MKRFYKQAEAGTAPGGYAVRLDGKILKTPMGKSLVFPCMEAAEAVAVEWGAQGEDIFGPSMPLTQLVNTLHDKTDAAGRAAMVAGVEKYGASDLVCYFATHPSDLLARQEARWIPLLEWLRQRHGIGLDSVRGIQYRMQDAGALARLHAVLSGLDAATLVAVQAATEIAGSSVIALALAQGKIDAEEAFHAACIDELYQIEKWGEDAQARARLEKIKRDLQAVSRFLAFFKSGL